MDDYKPLAHFISENQEELSSRLEGLSIPSDTDQIKELCIAYIGAFTSKDADFMNQLSLLEQDLISPMLNMINQLYATDIELYQQVRCAMPNKSTQSKGSRSFRNMIRVNVEKVLSSIYQDEDKEVEYRLNVKDANEIVQGLAKVGECIDQVLLTYRRHLDILQDEYAHKMALFSLDKKYISVLENYQTILGNLSSMESNPLVHDTIKQINHLLSSQGYKAVHYTDELSNLFDSKIGECTEAEEYKPAILKSADNKEALILKGGVVLPNKQTQQ